MTLLAFCKNSGHKLTHNNQNNNKGIKLKKKTPYNPKYEIKKKLNKLLKIKNKK